MADRMGGIGTLSPRSVGRWARGRRRGGGLCRLRVARRKRADARRPGGDAGGELRHRAGNTACGAAGLVAGHAARRAGVPGQQRLPGRARAGIRACADRRRHPPQEKSFCALDSCSSVPLLLAGLSPAHPPREQTLEICATPPPSGCWPALRELKTLLAAGGSSRRHHHPVGGGGGRLYPGRGRWARRRSSSWRSRPPTGSCCR